MAIVECNQLLSPGSTAWVMISTVLVLGMIPGLAFFEAGLLRRSATADLLMQIFAGFSINCFLWFGIGFTLVYGDTLGGAIGNPGSFPLYIGVSDPSKCFHDQSVDGLTFATFEMMFAAITPLLLTGAYAERLSFKRFLVINTAWEVLVYYPMAHWVWGYEGWLYSLGALDFAGGIVIHATAGASAIVFSKYLGPRKGTPSESSLPLAAIGAGLLWMGWFGFNAGSAMSAGAWSGAVVANTQIAAAASAVVWMLLASRRHRVNLTHILNGAIAGLAGVTPAAGYINVQASCILGIILGVASYAGPALINHKLGIDDALEVSSVHGIPGVVGALAIGFAATRVVDPTLTNQGVIYSSSMYLLAVQALALVVAVVLASVVSVLLCVATRSMNEESPTDSHIPLLSRSDDRHQPGVLRFDDDDDPLLQPLLHF